VLKGVTRELGRAKSFLVEAPGREGVPGDQEPWRLQVALVCERVRKETQTKKACKVSGEDSEE
jgi:hypothetical protein